MHTSDKIYLCASAEDSPQAERFSDLLYSKTGHRPNFVPARADHRKGDLPEAVIHMIKSCKVFFAIISENAIHSLWLADQIDFASQIDILVIPILVESFSFDGQLGMNLGTADCISIDNPVQMEKMLSNASSWLNAQSARGHEAEAIDMGLSVKWASCNLGSDFPDMPGDYFAWGEKSNRKAFGYNDYILKNKSYFSGYHEETGQNGTSILVPNTKGLKFLKYNMDDDGFYSLDSNDDPATLILGSPWRVPIRKEFQELLDNCDWEWVNAVGKRIGRNTNDGPCMNGYLVRSRITGNSVFLPACGVNFNEAEDEPVLMLSLGRIGAYWASDLKSSEIAFGLYFSESEAKTGGYYRYKGLCIRPVRDGAND